MRCFLCTTMLLLGALPVRAAADAKPNTLTPKEIADGWILLFDGETTFGWKVDGEIKVENGMLVLGGTKATTVTMSFRFFELAWEGRWEGANDPTYSVKATNAKESDIMIQIFSPIGSWKVQPAMGPASARARPNDGGRKQTTMTVGADRHIVAKIEVPAGTKLFFRNMKLKPLGLQPIFNGKDLTGWKEIPGKKSKFTVTDKGELNIKDGNGDIQTESQWDDFVLQLDIISNGKHLNSGVFFRGTPGEFWSGYESQIRNQWEGEDRTKPVDYGTGGIYNRQRARKVVPNDKEWFTKTVVAHGNHMAVWVNGYQVSDFTDTRPADKNARKGTKLDKGPISLQGHDPTTDLSFRNIRIAELPKAEKK